ncbi:molybdopterin biosynthesis protein [Desmospora sp. 8437]|nr:molybdopterin biosynthesis protein [Desmospora sp. 8437]
MNEMCHIPVEGGNMKEVKDQQIPADSFAKMYIKGELEDSILLDVREKHEWEVHHLEGSIRIPLRCLPLEWKRLDPGKKIYVLCAHGIRSLHATLFLYERGCRQVVNVEGGLARVSLYLERT